MNMTDEDKLAKLVDRLGAQRVWSVILLACFPNTIFISGAAMSTFIDNVQSIEEQALDPDDE